MSRSVLKVVVMLEARARADGGAEGEMPVKQKRGAERVKELTAVCVCVCVGPVCLA